MRENISIHAPVWGATICPDKNRLGYFHFNPRTRVGCDNFTTYSNQSTVYFNPRTRVGCDLLYKRY